MSEFFDMGGYARYLWPCFGVYLGWLLWLSLGSLLRHRKVLRLLSEEEGRA
ncbi:MAG: heme exporter protein CcmD [Oceanococcaceae bacterium]